MKIKTIRVGYGKFPFPVMRRFDIKNENKFLRNFPTFWVNDFVYIPEHQWIDIDAFQRFDYRRTLRDHTAAENAEWHSELNRLKQFSGRKLIWMKVVESRKGSKDMLTQMCIILGNPCGPSYFKWSWFDCVVRLFSLAIAGVLNLMIYGLWRAGCAMFPAIFPRNGIESLDDDTY